MGVDRPIDITADQRKTLLALLKRHLPNTTAWVYGSRAKWTARPQSDLDLVVFTTPDQDRRVAELREAFEESNLPFRVDLFVWDAVPEPFRKEIEAEHVVLVEKKERGVTGEWQERRWGDLATLEYGRALRGYGTAQGTFRVFGTNGPIGWHDEALCPHPSVIVGRKGAYRGVHYSAEPFFVIDTAFYLKPKVEMDVRWAYYELLTQDINLMDSGSAIPSTSREEFYGLPISVPPLSEQRAIAHVLGTLDDKIELNRRMNETLETMAQALFKSWFIDFDPVRAKAALRNHSPLEGESARQGRQPTDAPVGGITPPLRGSRQGKGASPQARRWGEIKRQYTQQTLQKSQTLRETRTDAEGLLWHYLRDKQLDGHKFRRQQPIGPYIVDFACMPQKLLIELDGGQHAEQHTYDQKRDAFLRKQGYKILRFWNNEIFENCFGVLESIYVALHHHSPLEEESAGEIIPPLRGSRRGKGVSPQPSQWGDEGRSQDESLSERGCPPPHQPSPHGSTSATPPQGGSDWTVERARAYLDNMDKEIADLFPDRLADSELGPIPEGWEVKALGECFNLTMGQSPPGSTYNEHGEGLPFFQGRTDFGFRYPENRKFCTAPTRTADPGDTLVSVRAPVGDINMAWEQCCIGRGVAALRHKTTATSYSYYFTWTIQSALREYEQTGTVFGAINKNQFESLQVLEPDATIVDAFDSCARRFDARIRSNFAESLTLAALRDALLPKLLSGNLLLRD